MKSISKFGSYSASAPILADEILEFHAARILMLLMLCGTKGHIDGLTKMAKLDFFVRYPQFFVTASRRLGTHQANRSPSVESAMVRYRYGPWDHRYYHVLSFLEGTRLIEVSRVGKAFRLALTPEGTAAAERLESKPSFRLLADQMREVKSTLGGKSGSALKRLIYQTFYREVAERQHGEVIS